MYVYIYSTFINITTIKIKHTINYILKLKEYSVSRMHKKESINRSVWYISYASLLEVSPLLPMCHLPGV